ncbi:MAG: DUF3881 family protein, partial [Lachnospiraceae bacterium]|nr:DUF3881 family protein [Lachnospiraceae bacterium]
MHSYFRAVGLSNITNAQATENLIKHVVASRDSIRKTEDRDVNPLREYTLEVAPGVCVTVRCEVDTDPCGESETPIRVLNYFPYISEARESFNTEVYINKKVDTRGYHGMCDDPRLGVSLIFHLVNAVDFLNSRFKMASGAFSKPVSITGLCLDGRIILPVEKRGTPDNIRTVSQRHMNIIADSAGNPQDAFDSITQANMDIYAEVMERAKKEDVYSIVETTFIPYGAESDIYSIVGELEEFSYR